MTSPMVTSVSVQWEGPVWAVLQVKNLSPTHLAVMHSTTNFSKIIAVQDVSQQLTVNHCFLYPSYCIQGKFLPTIYYFAGT